MHFGETLSEERFIRCIETAYEAGIRTFVTVAGASAASRAEGACCCPAR